MMRKLLVSISKGGSGDDDVRFTVPANHRADWPWAQGVVLGVQLVGTNIILLAWQSANNESNCYVVVRRDPRVEFPYEYVYAGGEPWIGEVLVFDGPEMA